MSSISSAYCSQYVLPELGQVVALGRPISIPVERPVLSMARTTNAQLQSEIAELKEKLAQAETPAELSKIEKRRQCANNTTVVLVNNCFPVTNRDGEVTEGGYKFPAIQSMDVNYGTKENSDWKKNIKVQETWFEVWNNGTPLGDQFQTEISSTQYAVVRVYWDFVSKPENIFYTDEVNEKSGKAYKKVNFKYQPAKRMFAYEVLDSKPAVVADPEIAI